LKQQVSTGGRLPFLSLSTKNARLLIPSIVIKCFALAHRRRRWLLLVASGRHHQWHVAVCMVLSV